MAKDLEIKVKLSLNELQKGITDSRGLIKSLDKEKASVVIDLKKEQLQADFAKIKADFQSLSGKPITAEIQLQKEKAIADLAGIKTQLKSLDKVKIDIEIDKSKIANAIAEIKTGISRELGAKLVEGLSAIPGAIATTTLQFEKLQTVLKTTLGSQGEADKAFAMIKSFAASTPFQVSAITDSFIKLSNRGITPTVELLTQLGDLASSQGKELDQITEAILDASTGEFERLKEFGIQASKSGDQVTLSFKGVEKTIANTPIAINAAIASFGNLEGVSGGMEAQSKTLGGALSNLQDNADKLSVAFGQELVPILLEIVKGFSETGSSAEGFARGAGQNVANAIKFLVDNGDKLKIVLELVVIQFTLVKAQAAGAAISTLASGAAALVASGGFTALAATATASAIAIGALVAPLAVAYAALQATNFIVYTNELKKFNEELDTSTKTAQVSGNETFKLAGKLKSLSEARKAGNADPAKEKAYLDITKQQLASVERLKKEQESLAASASDPSQKQAALNNAKGYEIEANALNGQISTLEKLKVKKDAGTGATKEQTKALKEQADEQAKLAKAKGDIDRAATAKRQDFARDEGRKTQEQGITKQRDTAVDNLKIKQEAEVSNFKTAQENKYNDIKRKGEKEIADFKDAKLAALDVRAKNFADGLEKAKEDAQSRREAAADNFRKGQEAADAKYQKQKEENQKKLAESLSGAKSIVDRETAIGTAKPEDQGKLKEKFAQEDRIRQQVASTNVDTKSTKEQFANQAKSIAGVGEIKNPEDASKVQLALTELEAKVKAQLAEEERKKDAEFALKKQTDEAAFKLEQKAIETEFNAGQKQAALDFETNILKPQKAAIEAELEVRKVAFEQGTLQPLKLQQEQALAEFRNQKTIEADALKAKYEADLDALKKAAKLEDINLDAAAQKEKLDREATFKNQQRSLDLENAKQVLAIISSSAKISGVGAAVGIGGKIPKFSRGVENFDGGLAYVHAGEVLMNLSQGTSVIPANKVGGMGGGNVEGMLAQIVAKLDRPNLSVTSAKDPNELIGEVYRQSAIASLSRSGA